jgi:hypothetical protein
MREPAADVPAVPSAWDRLRNSSLLHPVLFAIFPVAFVWSHNLSDDIPLTDVALVLGITLGSMIGLYLLFRLLLRDPGRAGLATTSIGLVVLSYGHVINLSEATPGSTRELALLLGFVILAAALLLASVSAGTHVAGATRVLNLVGAVLVLLNVTPLVSSGAFTFGTSKTAAFTIPPDSLDARAAGAPRDVYYLIFDRYGGEGALRDLYGYDNGPFVRSLEDRGFFVVPDAIANYPQTTHSLASSLNMTYLDDLANAVGEDSGNWRGLYNSLDDFTAARAFKAMGYEYDHVGSWFRPTAADQAADVNYIYDAPQEFPGVFLRTTMVPYLAPRLGIGHFEDLYLTEYHRVAFQFEALRRIIQDPRPTFTFAHLTLPHPPYVFGSDGRYQPEGTPGSNEQLYINQLAYTNTLISSLVDDLLAGPDSADPIVVLQSDEGPHSPAQDAFGEPFDSRALNDTELERKLHILNAYFLPGLDDSGLYPTITPVNTFRLIFDDYYGADLSLLPDRTYQFEDDGHPYRFTDITDRLRG